jgi:hypothetical protein
MATNTERLELRAEKAFIDSVEELAAISHTSKAEIIRRAVNLYAYAVEEAKKGNTLISQPISEPLSY